MTGNPTMRCHTSLFASECGYRVGAGKLRKLPSPELFMRCHGSDTLSLRGRRSKGQLEGKCARPRAREEGNSSSPFNACHAG